MKECKKCESLFEKALYDELGDQEEEFFNRHLMLCNNCASKFEELKATLSLINMNKKRELDETFMQNFWEILEPKLKNEKSANRSQHLRFPDWLSFNFNWKYQIAGGLVLLILGFFLGKYLTRGNEDIIKQAGLDKAKTEISENMVNSEALKYLERSKIILLGITNFDPSKDNAESINLPYIKKISKQLASQADVLKGDLREPSQQELKRLVVNLGLILLQIANLETRHDKEGIELIRDLVNSKGIFLKINIQQLLENNRKQDDQKERGNQTNKDNKRT